MHNADNFDRGLSLADAWVRVSAQGLRHNFAALKSHLASSARGAAAPQIIAVVKGNGYGHGLSQAGAALQTAGANFFAVTTPSEALELRSAGVTGRILVFLPALSEQLPELIAADLDLTICDAANLAAIVAACDSNGSVRVHLKVDSGMGRLGALPKQAHELGHAIAEASSQLQFAGIYTHFAKALERDPRPTQQQFELFMDVVGALQSDGISVGLRHCANSAALLRFPEMRLDAVRPGTILYGQYPSAVVPRSVELQSTWQLQARVISVRDVPEGTAIGYGGEFVTKRPTKLAVLPIGYGDGFAVSPDSVHSGMRGLKSILDVLTGRANRLAVTIRGVRAPVLGRVAMQICTVDVTDIPGVSAGDIADIPARRIMTSARLPRVCEE